MPPLSATKSERDDQENNEKYGPIDGIRPEDYPRRYSTLLQCRCISLIQGVGTFLAIDQVGHIFCQQCVQRYGERPLAQGILNPRYGFHNLTTKIEQSLNCAICTKSILHSKSAIQCQECIEQFLISEYLLILSNTVEVITQY